jgi:hypothetical protein
VKLHFDLIALVLVAVFLLFVTELVTMVFQFVPSCHDRPHDRPRQVVMSSSHANYPDDWLAQQSLFMGSSTPLYCRQVSMSPQDSYSAASRFVSAPIQGPIIDGASQISGRNMYPSSTYTYGTPGFYYDPMLLPNCVASQTHNPVPQVALYPVPQYNCMAPPTSPVVSQDIAFGDNGEFPPPQYSSLRLIALISMILPRLFHSPR